MKRRPVILLFVLFLPDVSFATDKVVPQNAVQIQWSYAPVVRQAAPAVVNIFTRQPDSKTPIPPKGVSDYRRYFGTDDYAAQTPLGSGVLVDPNGTIVTNEHVIHDAGQLTVVLNDRRQFDATLIRVDERNDLAVLKIGAGEALPFLEIRDSDELEVGDIVLAIGNPFGVGQTVTNGIVSALARTVNSLNDERTFIQTDAAINPGNSGGALVSLDGKLVGINTALYSEGGGSVGIGFAIPTALVRAVVDHPGTGQRIARPWLGARGRTITARVARRLGLPKVSGVMLDDVLAGGPAAAAGLIPGDVVLSIDGRSVDDEEALRFRFGTLPIGSTAQLVIWRQTQILNFPIRLMAPPEQPSRDVTQLKGGALTGVTVANLSPALSDELQTDDTNGIIVLDVPRNSAAAKMRLLVGDIITALNGQKLATVADLRQALMHGDATAMIGLKRDGRPLQVASGSG